MTTRYPHYLRPATGERWPARVVTVDCQCLRVSRADDPRHAVDTLLSWHAVTLLRDGDHYSHHSEANGNTAAGWWTMVDSCLSRGGTTYVVSNRAARQWSLLLLWEEMEHGTLSLSRSPLALPLRRLAAVRGLRAATNDPLMPMSAGAVSRVLGRNDGLFVYEDPPSILRAFRKDLPGLLEWIDTRNWGAECPADVLPGAPAAQWAARWFTSLASALQSYQLGSLHATAGSQALHGWRVGYYSSGVFVHCHPEALRLEGQGYYGGRCECYRIGDCPGPVYQLDVRSMYPWVCVTHTLPIRLEECCANGRRPMRESGYGVLSMVADVDIDTDEPVYPLRRGTDVIYPVGHYRTTLAGPELSHALEAGRLRSVHAWARYDMGRPLKAYMEALYRLRCECDAGELSPLKGTVKRLLVCLPGKLGQKDRQWIAHPDGWSDVRYGSWWGEYPPGAPCRFRALAGMVQREEVGGFAPEAVPAIAAWITSYARLRLWELIQQAGRGNVWYCDTDSLFTNEVGYERLGGSALSGARSLGRLELRHGPCRVSVRGIKYYVTDGTPTCAGIPKGHQEDAGDGEHYWYYPTPAEAIWAGGRPRAERVLRSYQRSQRYTHGEVAADGTVTPIRLGGWA